MRRNRLTILRITLTLGICAVCGLLIVGYYSGRSGRSASNNSGNAAPPATQAAVATQPAATEPAQSILIINNQEQFFPRAMLRLTPSDGKCLARLYSDDPSGVLSGKQTVNSYDFDMSLDDISAAAQISQAVWNCKSPSSERQDTPYGIFLNGDTKQVLQPMNVTVHFAGQPPHVRVFIEGMFWEYPMSDEQMPAPPPTMVAVFGSLDATVPGK